MKSDIAIPYSRNAKRPLVIYEDDSMEHIDVCPGCNSPIMWQRECEEWEVLDDNTEVPSLWTSWHTECSACMSVFICPYDDGLVYYAGRLK